MFARKPAPVQVTWLGYFATTGVAEMDYVLVDPHVAPHSEGTRFVDGSGGCREPYLCFTPPAEALGAIRCRASAGRVTFGCFNNLAKVNDASGRAVVAGALAVPGSRCS